MKVREFLLGLVLWAIVVAGMVGASVAFGAILYRLVKG